MNIMSRMLRRFVKSPWPPTSSGAEKATETDLYYCYRLLLNREPDDAGWNYWTKRIGKRQLTLRTLTDTFLNDQEFLSGREQSMYSFFFAAARQIQLVQQDGFKLHARANDLLIGAPIIRGAPYETHVVRQLRLCLKPGMVFVDIGANIGYFSLLAASLVGSGGKVLAFEPNIDNCELIKLSIQANGFENITVYPYAVADEEATVQLVAYGSNGMIASFEAGLQAQESVVAARLDGAEGAFAHYITKSVVLDDALRDVERIDVIKVDIEGFEGRALQGMQGLIRKHRPVIFSEFSPGLIEGQSGMSPEAYLDMFRASEYDIYAIRYEGVTQAAEDDDAPMSNAELMEYHSQANSTHIDIIARPR